MTVGQQPLQTISTLINLKSFVEKSKVPWHQFETALTRTFLCGWVRPEVATLVAPRTCLTDLPQDSSETSITHTAGVNTMCAIDLGRVYQKQGAVSIRKTVLPGMAIPMLKIRRPNGRLILNMEIAIRR